MSAHRWLTYFPELTTPAELAELFGSVSAQIRPEPAIVRRDVGTVGPETISRVRALVREFCADRWPFVEFAIGLTAVELAGLVGMLDRHPALGGGDEVIYRLLKPVLGMVQDHLVRTLITELHADRRAGRLTGDSPEARFESFVDRLGAPGYQEDFRSRYPVLADDLARIVGNHTDYLRAILDAVATEHPALAGVCAELGQDDRVIGISTGSGDPHRRGRSVAIVEFASGAKVVHKPRSLQVDLAFQTLLRRLDGIVGLDLHTPWLLSHPSHGWMEFVEYTALAGEQEARSYYRKIGVLTGLLYALDACDIHHENIICHHGSPVLIDLETLFHPTVSADADGKSATAKIGERLARSVVGIGILPTVIGKADGLIDVGGIGFENGQRTPFRTFSFVNYGRDDMYISFDRQNHQTTATVPQLSGTTLSAAAVSDEVCGGFAGIVDWIIGNKTTFVALIDELFAGVEVRYLHNPTFFYAQILRMSTHPALLADPSSRHAVLHRVALRRRDAPSAVTRAEHRDLSLGDVPYFFLHADGTELFDSCGTSLGDLLDQAPLRVVAAKVAELNESERDAQLALIAASFVNKLPAESDKTGFMWPTAARIETDDRDERMAETIRLGDQVLDTMVASDAPGTTPNWLSAQVSSSVEQLWKPGPLGLDCYGGVTGVGYFLAMLGAVSGEQRFSDAALEVFTPVSELLARGELTRKSLSAGAFLGTAGIVYTMAHAGRALGARELTAAALTEMHRLDHLVPQDNLLDLVGGSAGVLAVALAMHDIAGTDDQRSTALALAGSAYEHLRDRFSALNGNPDQETLFSGFAHGVGGVYPYLARYARLADDAAADEDVDALLRVQDGMLDESGQDWYTSTLRVQRSYGWCHGSPGILLGLCLLDRAGTGRDLAGRIKAAAARTLDSGFGNNVTYCHGDFGNLEILRLCAQVTRDAELAAQVRSAEHALFRGYRDRTRRRTDCRHLYANCMMVGTTGIGFALLRSIDPDRVPALLWLD